MPLIGPRLIDTIDLEKLLLPGLSSKPGDVVLQSVSTSRHWTWEELDRDSDRLAAHLIARGLKPGDRVASLMPNRNELLVFYLACLKARLVITPLNYRYMAPEIDHALGLTEASILLCHAERDSDLAKCETVDKLPLGTIFYGATDQRGPALEKLLAEAPPEVALPQPEPSDPVIIFFTSGSTGKPKGVTHTRQTFGAFIASAVHSHEMTSDDIVLPGSSISHSGGVIYSFMALAIGGRIIMPRTFDADEIMPLLREHKPTLLWMLPAALISMIQEHKAEIKDFASVRLCTSGGDKVPAELETEFTDLAGFSIDEVWGMSEIGIATINPPSGINKLGSVGVLGPGYEGSVRDEAAGPSVDQGPIQYDRLLEPARRYRGNHRRRLAGHGRCHACRRGRLLPVRWPEEADHRPRWLEHQPAGSRRSRARPRSRGKRRCGWRARPHARRERMGLCHFERGRPASDVAGHYPARAGTGRLQGTRGDCRA